MQEGKTKEAGDRVQAVNANSERALVSLHPRPDRGALLVVVDEGQGFVGGAAGSGLRGMRERADLIGAELSIGENVSGGVRVELIVPGQHG